MKKVNAQKLFFPAASIYAAMAVLLSVFALHAGWPRGLIATGHGHEMFFGFTLALIAGYNLGKITQRLLLALFVLWLAARISYLLAPSHLISQWLSPLFALFLAWHIVPRFFAAKKWRNKVISPLLLIICLLPALWLLQQQMSLTIEHRQLVSATLLLLILLMAFFGGRMIAPTTAGELQKQGIRLQTPVQPRLEALILLLLPLGALSILVPSTKQLAGVPTFLAACVLMVRLVRWQVWRCPNRPDLFGLAVGYLWLALGTSGLSLAFWFKLPVDTILHMITVGAIGCLSASLMLKSRFKRSSTEPRPMVASLSIISLISLATILRVIATADTFSQLLLWLSAVSWALAFIRLGFLLLSDANNPSRLTTWRQAI
ncbi:NnrS family protein [Kangiella shandongensis]|uniref:NnrS family protein n=1 Tax=Kangiella shandongensis TaxID=2763258 RepID=UPI001CBE1349|nr:NnrS family protein [Kangiella shandongensis]